MDPLTLAKLLNYQVPHLYQLYESISVYYILYIIFLS
jgi:hypothetical protein